jgi:hypothetical protein
MNTINRPWQFSLQAIFWVLVIAAGASATVRDLLLFLLDPAAPREPSWTFGPAIAWLAIGVLYWRTGFADLLFVHALLPGLAVCLLMSIALPSLSLGTHPGFWREFPPLAYWVLYVVCLLACLISLGYGLWLLAIGAVDRGAP